MDQRLLPGEGGFELERASELVRDRGLDLPVVVEVLNAEWRGREIGAFAQACAKASRRAWGASGR